jgi:iron complex outermembrane receptor protein
MFCASNFRVTLFVTASSGILSCAAPGHAAVPGQVETILVTARKTNEDIQQVPGSVAALNAAELESAGINNFQDLTYAVPNVSMSGGIAGTLQGQVGIRGIATLVRNIGIESGVGFYVDGVYQGRPENYNQEFIDIAQIEVLRGPQGTFFGKNTIAGAFSITTIRPVEDETRVRFHAELGNYGLARFQGYATGPVLGDKLTGKLSLGYVTQDGIYKHLSGGPDGDSLKLFSYRGSLYFTAGTATEFILTADGLHDRGKPAFFQVTDLAGPGSPHEVLQETTPLTIDNNRPNSLDRDNYGLSLTGSSRFSAGLLTSITAYRRSSYQASLDDDQNQIDYVAIDRWGDRTRFWTQELRFNGEVGARAEYLLGLFYLGQTITTKRKVALGADTGIAGEPLLTTNGTVNSDDYSAYGNVKYAVTDVLTASLGLRLSRESKEVAFHQGDPGNVYVHIGYPDIDYANEVSHTNLSPTAALSYHIAPEAMAYLRVARGFKSAAFNVDIVSSATGLAAGPESATSYEVGLKSDLFERRVRANFALFRTNYDDMQVSQLLGTAVVLANAARAEINGAEAEITAFLTPQLRFDLGVGAIDARYANFQNCGIPASLGGGSMDASGNRIIGAPQWTARVGALFSRPTSLGLFSARLDYEYMSPVFYEGTNAARFTGDARNVLNARLGLERGNFGVAIWVKNLTDDIYATYADDRSAVGALKTTAYGAPRTFGISLSSHF